MNGQEKDVTQEVPGSGQGEMAQAGQVARTEQGTCEPGLNQCARAEASKGELWDERLEMGYGSFLFFFF